MRIEFVSLTLLASLTLSVCAQQAAQNSPKPVYGSVTGHVYCSDTNDPARLGTVTLPPIADTLKSSFTKQNIDPHTPRPVFRPVPTLLDGSFTMPRVTPGYYYVVVQYPGYLSPISQFTSEEIAHPSPKMQKFIADTVPTIAVDANRTTTTDIRLQHGASISGTVRFDDGSPAAGLHVRLFHKDEKDGWIEVVLGTSTYSSRSQTNDQGYYRLSGLAAGEYIVRVDFDLEDIVFSSFFTTGSSTEGVRYSIPIYSGGKMREKDAKSISLHDGEDDSSEDIIIPVTKLHSVSGAIVEASNGRAINSGTVVLLNSDDKTQAASAKVDGDSATFHFDFVPEGSYILKITNARDVSREEIPMGPPGVTVFPPTRIQETMIKAYEPAEQAIIVQGDMSGIVIPVPDKSAPVKAPQ